ncbi:hypothetical protein ACFS5L_30875 [Streptomyces phyllanthi]|uniref:Maltokinase n=1 Tax=Streptomyces phyllanthi TaxID=1803180 RepID=A0A5N8W1M0_9ACTN|nr:hypothetical protein [Streptomyces phyllanthi]MPY41159.1 hypothetical protein [Streptomyces phyllanthi]
MSAVVDATDVERLTAELRLLLPGWLTGRRWFAGKGHHAPPVEPVLADLVHSGDPALLHLVVRAGQAGHEEWYQLLVGVRRAGTGTVPDGSLIGRGADGDGSALLLYEATEDPELMSRLLARLAAEGTGGPVEYHRLPDADVPLGLPARVLTAEQSNTSVAFGDRLMLKVLRRLVPGPHPELEMLTALWRAGDVPSARPLAWAQTSDAFPAGRTTLAVLQQFVPSLGDGWALATAGAARVFRSDQAGSGSGAGCRASQGGGGRQGGALPTDDNAARRGAGPREPGMIRTRGPEGVAGEGASVAPFGGFTEEARALGRATAEVHSALARQLDSRALTPAEADELAAGLTRRLDEAVDELPELLPFAGPLRDIHRSLRSGADRGRPLLVQRVHGDLHLGQVLRAPHGWVLIDFEGEPGHPLHERRRLQPAVRDVAAMLRSFDYAAHHALSEVLGTPPAEHAPLGPRGARLARRASAWAVHNRRAFSAGYAEAGGTDPRCDPVLLRAFEADKAVYEAVYEARNRPEWLPIPLEAVRRLAHGRTAAA